MKRLFLTLTLFAIVGCKKDKPEPEKKELQIIVSNVSNGTTYNIKATNENFQYEALNVSNGTENKTYAVSINSGEKLKVEYVFKTPNVNVGVGTIQFVYNGQNRGAVANGNGTTIVTIP